MEEQFRVCFESYEISNFGNCRRKLFNEHYTYIKGSIQNRGYRYFQVNRGGKRQNILFHHMVAKCFLDEKEDPKHVIDHIDRNKLNNHVSNLRYLSHADNIRNSDKYRDDIEETGKARVNILSRERYEKKNGYKYRKRGTGSIKKRYENSRYGACIIIKKVRYYQSFDTIEEAEIYLTDVIERNFI